jgi:hypothetical protein
LGNLVVFAGPETTLTQLQSAHHIIVAAIEGALPGASSLSSRPNVKWSKLLIRSMPTGVTDRSSQAFSHKECHQALLHDNPSYCHLQVTQLPLWVRKLSLYTAHSSSSLVVSFEDPDGSILSSLLATRHLFGFGAQLSVRKWCQAPPSTSKNVAAVKQCQCVLKHMAKAAGTPAGPEPAVSLEIQHSDGTFTWTFVLGPTPSATYEATPAPPLAPSGATPTSLPAPNSSTGQHKKRKMEHVVSQPASK